MKTELFRSTPGGIRYWSIEADYSMGQLIIEHGKYGGSLQCKEEDIEENQSGRDLDDQIDHRIESRINGKRDIGYRYSIEEAKKAEGTNMMGKYKPMLATRLDRIKHVNYDKMYLQMKYDGHRCLVTSTANGLLAYSRNGKRITTIDHILEGIVLDAGETIDGELYCHNTPLQRITSWAKKKQPDTIKLEYIVYDVIQSAAYKDRYLFISNLQLGKHAKIAPTDKNIQEDQMALLLSNSKQLGYEGLILRDMNMPYQIDKRSKGLIKVKQFMDAEFKVVDIVPSSDMWAILICEIPGSGLTFRVSAPGTMYQKEGVYRRKDEFIGERVTVSFANYTVDGKPFHPIAERWKQDL